MTYETYLKYRKLFLKQYREATRKNPHSVYVYFTDIKIRDFPRFIYLFNHDCLGLSHRNVVSSISNKKYRVGKHPDNLSDGVRIIRLKSRYDKYPEEFDKVQTFYEKTIKPLN